MKKISVRFMGLRNENWIWLKQPLEIVAMEKRAKLDIFWNFNAKTICFPGLFHQKLKKPVGPKNLSSDLRMPAWCSSYHTTGLCINVLLILCLSPI